MHTAGRGKRRRSSLHAVRRLVSPLATLTGNLEREPVAAQSARPRRSRRAVADLHRLTAVEAARG